MRTRAALALLASLASRCTGSPPDCPIEVLADGPHDGGVHLMQRDTAHVRQQMPRPPREVPGSNKSLAEIYSAADTNVRPSAGSNAAVAAADESAKSNASADDGHQVEIHSGANSSWPATSGIQAISVELVADAEKPAATQPEVSAAQESNEVAGGVPQRNKVVLMLIDMFPPCWILGVDRFYLGDVGMGIAKLTVCVCTCSIGGIIWGLIDFVAVMLNAFKKAEAIGTLGMKAKFGAEQVDVAYMLAFVDVLMVPFLVVVGRGVYQWRKQQRMERLKEAAMKSPHYGQMPGAAVGGK